MVLAWALGGAEAGGTSRTGLIDLSCVTMGRQREQQGAGGEGTKWWMYGCYVDGKRAMGKQAADGQDRTGQDWGPGAVHPPDTLVPQKARMASAT